VRCSIVITTKNRKDELAKALVSALNQNAHEVIVWDDGSTDGTADFVAQHFTSVQLVRSNVSVGLINARNQLAQIATGDLLFSIDDDAVLQPSLWTTALRRLRFRLSMSTKAKKSCRKHNQQAQRSPFGSSSVPRMHCTGMFFSKWVDTQTTSGVKKKSYTLPQSSTDMVTR
jgi:glycosyltransferase involved in cell wall biosynthesis